MTNTGLFQTCFLWCFHGEQTYQKHQKRTSFDDQKKSHNTFSLEGLPIICLPKGIRLHNKKVTLCVRGFYRSPYHPELLGTQWGKILLARRAFSPSTSWLFPQFQSFLLVPLQRTVCSATLQYHVECIPKGLQCISTSTGRHCSMLATFEFAHAIWCFQCVSLHVFCAK